MTQPLARPVWLLGAALLVTVLVYLPGLGGPFVFDDSVNIVDNPAVQLDSLAPAALGDLVASGGAGPLGRPVAMLSFGANHYLFGPGPYSYKLLNLIIHLINGLLVYRVCRLLLQSLPGRATDATRLTTWTAAAVAAAWLLHPLNLSAVLYVVQRMTSLSALFSLLALAWFLEGRRLQLQAGEHGATGWRYIMASLGIAVPLAAFSKENGLLVPGLMAVIELTLLQLGAERPVDRQRLKLLYGLLLGVPALATVGVLLVEPGFLIDYSNRSFTLSERLLTEARVLWSYVQWVLLPVPGALSFYHDDVLLSSSLLDPPVTLLALSAWLVVAGFALFGRRWPLWRCGVLFFLAAHSMESGPIALELVFEHRNYLPMLGLLLPLGDSLSRGLAGLGGRDWRVPVLALALGLLALSTATRAVSWRSLEDLSTANYLSNPASARANYDMARVYATRLPLLAEEADRARYFAEAERLSCARRSCARTISTAWWR